MKYLRITFPVLIIALLLTACGNGGGPVAAPTKVPENLTVEDLTAISKDDAAAEKDAYYGSIAQSIENGLSFVPDESRGEKGLEFIDLFLTDTVLNKKEDNYYSDLIIRYYVYIPEQEDPGLLTNYYTMSDETRIGFSPIWVDAMDSDPIQLDPIFSFLLEYRENIVPNESKVGVLKFTFDAEDFVAEQNYDKANSKFYIDAEDLKTYSALFGDAQE